MQSLVAKLQSISAGFEDRTALMDSNACLSYRELVIAIEAWCDWLKVSGAKTVALHGQNSVPWVVVDLACQELGIKLIPLPSFFSAKQLSWSLAEAGVDLVLSDQDTFTNGIDFKTPLSVSSMVKHDSFYAWKISGVEGINAPQATQKITFTSGSTGSPKGVCLSSEHQWQVAQSLAQVIGLESPKHLCLLPLSTLLENIAGVYSPLLMGGCVVIKSDQERGISQSSSLDLPQLIKCLEAVQPTSLILVPQLLSALVIACQSGWQAPDSLRFIAVGGGRVSTSLLREAQGFGLPVFQGYGLSECGSVVALNTPQSKQLESVGKVLPHCEVTIEDCEVVVSGSSHLGYLGDKHSAPANKVYTGDLGRLENGYLYIDGRKKNLLITSFGRNVSPEWLEAEILSASDIYQCMVVGDGKPYLSALIGAPLTTTDKAIEQWLEEVNQQLPDYAQIQAWFRVDLSTLSDYTTANGRLQRGKIMQDYSDQIEALYTSKANNAVING